jgi:DNA replication and repair protein RecF
MYSRSLKQRNKMLASARDGRGAIEDSLLESWDESILKPGAKILYNRLRYVQQMKQELPQGLFGTESMKMHYYSTIATEECSMSQIEEMFRERLRQSRTNDLRTGYTSVGPHRDELKLFVNGKSLVDFGSAGQQRSGLLSLYFSQMEIHRKTHGFYPVFLVDDAEAELDTQRIDTFLKFLSQRTQTFLTSAKDFMLTAIPESTRHFSVKNGMVSADSSSL